MRNFIRLVVIYICVAFISTAQGATDIKAPFGFVWDQTESALRARGLVLNCSIIANLPMNSCKVTTAPKKFSKAEFFQLLFVPNEGLQKVMMVGKDITGDPYGSSGKEQYNALKVSLTKKYGDPKTFEYGAIELYKDADEFYECLAYQNCGTQAAYWTENVTGTIALELDGLSRGKGYLTLKYESARWSDLIDKMNNDLSAGDDDSL